MNRERETLLDEIEQSLWTLTEDNLRHLCVRCGIGGVDDSEVKGKSRRALRRKLIQDYCEKEDLMESEDEGIFCLLQLKDEIKVISDSEDAANRLPTSPSQSASTTHLDSEPSGETGAAAGRKEEVGGPQSSRKFTGILPVLPLEVLEEMLLNVPPQQVVCVCRLVCREWKEVVDSDSLWRERCRREGYQTYVTKLPKDWRLFYFLCKKRRNLLKNPRADDKFKGWQIMENGGDKWKIESVEEVPLPDNTVQKYFATSYSTCRKSQLIDLEKEGYRPSFMDDFQPDIIISDWYAPRRECGAKYEICVELLNHKKQPIKKFSPGTVIFQNWDDHKWNQMTHVFKNYGPGVRYIRFIHGGKDTLYWAGWYGIRVTNSSIEICPSVDR
ncbi:F-box only protein 44-like [Oncorhynchus clarkii lewisi]|uniref:F-box only protein 44-like n=1 Tax=Oncorhynchus clarkii lewisi TaxID=490388 RepID=UPI0039B93589